jgi:hypothetical protein
MSQLAIFEHVRVDVELISQDNSRELLQLTIVADQAADFAKGRLGLSTPLAQTLWGHTAGETLDYTRGDIVRVKILSVQPVEGAGLPDAGETRDEALRRARDKAQHANMVSFALTFDSKWGDYDPERIQENWDVPKTDVDNLKKE